MSEDDNTTAKSDTKDADFEPKNIEQKQTADASTEAKKDKEQA